ncbi:hypothetical protein CR983_01620 [Candidatus Saccharibacteria bacterium]|nr:MAG: hypothetical protein CR983_01620 [Candidatus Saccharibacteria bacterium]
MMVPNVWSWFANSIKINPQDIGVERVNASDATLAGVLGTVYFWAGAIAVLIIVIAGMLYVTANGDSNRIERAKNAILYAVVGLIVVMFAFVITQFVLGAI